MNEFTKQELIDLHCSLYGGVNDDHPVANHLIVLQNKIQSMIDNYCEHEWKKCFADFEYDECTRCGECEL